MEVLLAAILLNQVVACLWMYKEKYTRAIFWQLVVISGLLYILVIKLMS